MVLNNELMGLMMAERINIWYPLRKSRFHILVWKILWNISLERKLCGYFQSSVHSLRRLYKLNCLQILKTTNKTSVGEEIYFLCAWLKASWETWNVVTTSTFHKRGGGQRRNPLTHHIYFWFRWEGKYLVLHIRKEGCSLKTLTPSLHSSLMWGLHHIWRQDQERQMWPGHGDRARLMSRAGQWDFRNIWR